jgi:hypothetical protein
MFSSIFTKEKWFSLSDRKVSWHLFVHFINTLVTGMVLMKPIETPNTHKNA